MPDEACKVSERATYRDDLITELMIKYARREKLPDEEMDILEEWWVQFPEHEKLKERFNDPEWSREELAKMKPAPMREIWEEINKYLDEIGAPDDREGKEWNNYKNRKAWKVWLHVRFCRLLCWTKLRKREDDYPL